MMRGLYLVLFLVILEHSSAFVQTIIRVSSQHPKLLSKHVHGARDGARRFASNVSVGKYQHKEFQLTYLHKKSAPGRENDNPIILIHPVGVGLSSWFWAKVMESFHDNPPIYAPDLIGCGLDHGADPWDPEEVGLFFPLSWAEGVETLMREVIQPSSNNANAPNKSWIGKNNAIGGGIKTKNPGCLVVAQGGLAPVGIMLAARNPNAVKALMLTSPPTHEDVTTAVSQAELQRNYELLRSPVWGNLAFSVLENRAVIRFFSDLFLFSEKCDDAWLDEAARESKFREARTPVQAFNAGLMQHRSFETELQESSQPLMVVSGTGDKRVADRQGYESARDADAQTPCALKTIDGTNVLPWENPAGIVRLIEEMGF